MDGAHTPTSAAALAKTLRQTFGDIPIAFIVAMADDKDHAGAIYTPPVILIMCWAYLQNQKACAGDSRHTQSIMNI